MRLFCISLLFLASNVLLAQQNNVWYFGNNAGINWSSGTPDTFTTPFTTAEACGTVCDGNGNLLFYSDGVNVYNSNQQMMPNGNNLGGMSSSTTVLIVPKPGDCGKFYVFTTEDHTSAQQKMYYSVVDMCLNNGLGDVVAGQKAVWMHDHVSEKLVVVPNSNGTDLWLVSHELGNNSYVVFDIAAVGINMTPNLYSVGSSIAGNTSTGFMKVSPTGNMIAFGVLWGNVLQVADFSPSTGVVSCPCNNYGPTLQNGSNGLWYGLEFSPNGNYLYASCSGGFGPDAALYQIDLATGLADTIYDYGQPPVNYFYDELQLAPDGKIYMARNQTNYLGVINNPDVGGTGCNYVDQGLMLANGSSSQAGLPPAVLPTPANAVLAVNLGNDTSVCTLSPITLSAPVGCGYNYVWQDGSTQSSFTASQPGSYFVHVTNACGVGNDTVNVAVGSISVQVSGAATVCQGSPVSLTASGASSYTWSASDGSVSNTSVSIVVSPASTTTYSAIGSQGTCLDTAILVVTVSPVPTISLQPGSGQLCQGDSLTLIASGAASYAWQPNTNISATNSPSVVVHPASSVTYVVVGTNANGCTAQNSISITVTPFTPLAVSNDTVVCYGSIVTLHANGTGQITWNAIGFTGNGSSASVSPLVTSTYHIVSSVGSCMDSASVVVTVNPVPTVFITPNADTICPGQSAALQATGANAYQWNPTTALSPTSGANVLATPAATQLYAVIGSSNGCNDTASALVVVTTYGSIHAGPDTLVCPGSVVQLFAQGNGAISWTSDTNLSCYSCDSPTLIVQGTTYVVATSSDPCYLPDTIHIQTTDVVAQAYGDTAILLGGSANLNAFAYGGSYSWCDNPTLSCTNCLSPVASPTVTTTYCFTTQAGSCIATDTVRVIVIDSCLGLAIPNAFSPNGDGINDMFRSVELLDDKFLSMRIFNRWGQLMYETTSIKGAWDGTYQSVAQPIGVYVYIVEIICNGKTKLYKGNVTLMR